MAEDSKKELGDAIPTAEQPESVYVAVPELFLCPISRQIMSDPVTISNGRTFDRSSIKNLLEAGIEACPITKQPLANSYSMTNYLAWELIHDWCKKHNNFLDLFRDSSSSPLYLKRYQFHPKKLLSESPEDQKEAAKEVLKETTEKSYNSQLFAGTPGAICNLDGPLLPSDTNPKSDLQIQEDYITELLIDEVNNGTTDFPKVNRMLIASLTSENVEIRKKGIEMTRDILERKEIMPNIETLLEEEKGVISIANATEALIRLHKMGKHEETAVGKSALGKIEEDEIVDVMLECVADLSTVKETVERMDKSLCLPLLRLIRYGVSKKIEENVTVILLNVLKRDGSDWKDMVKEEEYRQETISAIVENGTQEAKKNAAAILEVLKSL